MAKYLTAAVREKVTAAFQSTDDSPKDIFSVFTTSHEERVCVIGNHRIALYKIHKLSKPVMAKGFHLYDLQKIRNPDATKIILVFKGNQTLTLAYLQKHILQTILDKICEIYCILTYGWPRSQMATISLREVTSTDPFKMDKIPQFGGFRESYHAFCGLKKTKASTELLNYIKELPLDCKILDLSAIPGLVESGANLPPVLEALRYNKYFTGLMLSRVHSHIAPVIQNLAYVFEKNKTLAMLSLTHSALAGVDVAPLMKAISVNKHCALTDLDLSSNKLGDRGFNEVASAIWQSLRLETLNLANNQATPRGVATLVSAVSDNYFLLQSLKFLDFSNNKFGPSGTSALCKWLNKLFEQNKSRRESNKKKVESGFKLSKADLKMNSWGLEVIALSDCHLDVSQVLGTLRMNDEAFQNLLRLDISHNRMSKQEGQNLAKFLMVQPHLSEVNVSHTSMQGSSLSVIMHGIMKNRHLDSITIQAAGNEMGPESVPLFEPVLRASFETQLKSLSLANNSFGNDGTVQVLNALKNNTVIEKVAIGLNLKYNLKVMESVGEQIGDALATLGGLKTLNFRGSEKSFLGNGLIPILSRISNLPSLEVLDISGNQVGDEGSSAVVNFLQSCKTLRVLNVDRNNMGVPSYSAFKSSLTTNKNLLRFEPPMYDLHMIATHSRKRAEQIENLMESINAICESNVVAFEKQELEAKVQRETAAKKQPKKVLQTTATSSTPVKTGRKEKAAPAVGGDKASSPEKAGKKAGTVKKAQPVVAPKVIAPPAPSVLSERGKDSAASKARTKELQLQNEVADLEAQLEAKKLAKLERKKQRHAERLRRMEMLEAQERELALREKELELENRERRLRERIQLELEEEREREREREEEAAVAAERHAERLIAERIRERDDPLEIARPGRNGPQRGPVGKARSSMRPRTFSSSLTYLQSNSGGGKASPLQRMDSFGGDGFGNEDNFFREEEFDDEFAKVYEDEELHEGFDPEQGDDVGSAGFFFRDRGDGEEDDDSDGPSDELEEMSDDDDERVGHEDYGDDMEDDLPPGPEEEDDEDEDEDEDDDMDSLPPTPPSDMDSDEEPGEDDLPEPPEGLTADEQMKWIIEHVQGK